jgi:hypothetical protein
LAPYLIREAPPEAALCEADAGTRTPDPFITSEVLYQLSYVGAAPDASEASAAPGDSPSVSAASPPRDHRPASTATSHRPGESGGC